MTRDIPVVVAQTSADAGRPVYQVRSPGGDVLATTRGQAALRDVLLGLERQCDPGEHLAITWIDVPSGDALWEAWRAPLKPPTG